MAPDIDEMLPNNARAQPFKADIALQKVFVRFSILINATGLQHMMSADCSTIWLRRESAASKELFIVAYPHKIDSLAARPFTAQATPQFVSQDCTALYPIKTESDRPTVSAQPI